MMKSFKDPAGTHGYTFDIEGDNTPYVEIVMKPGKKMLAEAGTFMAKQPDVKMTMALGDGKQTNILSKAFGAAKRKISGDNALFSHFENVAKDNSEQLLVLTAPHPGQIIAIDLAAVGGSVICQKGAFMAAPSGTSVDLHLRKKISTSMFGGEGFVMQKVTGNEHVFLNAGGNFTNYELAAGQKLQVDTGCLLAVSSTVDMGVEFVASASAMLFGQEGLMLATLEGPGQVWLQSMPFKRQINAIAHELDSRYKKGFLSSIRPGP
jgi:uncharacterized protein (AIM24 family)